MNICFTIIDEATGDIISSGSQDSAIDIVLEPGQRVIKGKVVNGVTHRINLKTGRVVKRDKHPVFKVLDIHSKKSVELGQEIVFRDHRIGVTDGDMKGWFEVAEVFRVLSPETYIVETNSGKLSLDQVGWMELYSAILRHRQGIINRAFGAVRRVL